MVCDDLSLKVLKVLIGHDVNNALKNIKAHASLIPSISFKITQSRGELIRCFAILSQQRPLRYGDVGWYGWEVRGFAGKDAR
ncbi:hypothetical protein [Bartonella krasnovii]|uniref:Uncharacterized protein n=1 Tax=Bartonella krasnovii TaxID=2267275 RepID=A0A5B9D3M6_9HYPH|nr:hypothetical protein [Bartonella krasnovii]QEE12845.1 hypothetical protein D1092_07865 [Bartonella krasnovii]UNF35327.1 hypothetical protein MNL12_07085 [Bartonella krasnovii]UNF36956.1 hypothetical protein MNL11_07765 [Bartonella krasnovii]UNF38643.1 hypothetical protein MNL10_07960 [Bartonella krasnovii]UNF40370.1 hypothetical protein MNL09_08095 [Bartonella krasnovii]